MYFSTASLKKALATAALAASACLSSAPAMAQIPVTDGALIGVQNLFKQMTEEMTKEYLGKEVIQKYLGDNTIKSYLGDNIITQQLGENTIKKFLGEDVIKGYLGNDILGKMVANSDAVKSMTAKLETNEGSYGGNKFTEIKTTTKSVLDKTKDLEKQNEKLKCMVKLQKYDLTMLFSCILQDIRQKFV